MVPRAIPGLKGISVSRIACGDTFSMLLTEQGILMSYGKALLPPAGRRVGLRAGLTSLFLVPQEAAFLAVSATGPTTMRHSRACWRRCCPQR